MKNNFLFSGRQKFNQWWLWLIMLSINAVFIILITIQYSNLRYINPGLLVGIGINTLFAILQFFYVRLDTQITEEGINVRFVPFHFSTRKILWKDVTSSFVRSYSPIGEFGGWGIRYGFSGKGKAYNVSGNQGIQLVFTDGSKLLIGTNKPDEVRNVLKNLGKYSEE